MTSAVWGPTFAALAALGACANAAPSQATAPPDRRPPPGVGSVSPPRPSATASPAASAQSDEPSAVHAIPGWGVDVTLAAGEALSQDADTDHYRVEIAQGVSVSLERIPRPAPRAIEPQPRLYGEDPEVRTLAEGTTTEGALFAIRSFRVRIGFPGMPGQTIHTWKRVSRAYVALSIDAHSHAACTGYVEHDADTQSDPDIARVARICLSVSKHR